MKKIKYLHLSFEPLAFGTVKAVCGVRVQMFNSTRVTFRATCPKFLTIHKRKQANEN